MKTNQPHAKQYLVHVPASQREVVASVFAKFPGVSPAHLILALLHAAKPLGIANALASYAVHKSKGPER